MVDGQAEGHGKLCNDIKGYSYEGRWLKDVPCGYGKEIWTGTSEYEGEFDNGVKSGIGMYKKFGDFEYRGGFVKDKFDGIGRLHLVNG